MTGFAILLGFNVLGMVLHDLLHVPLPANVIGFICFTAALFLKWVKLEWVERSAQFLLSHLMLFFAPFVVGTIVFVPLLRQHWASTVVSLVFSTLIVLVTTGWIVQRISGSGKRGELP